MKLIIARKNGRVVVSRLKSGGSYVEALFVDEEHRGLGIETSLMTQVIRKCNPPIYLFVSSEFGADYQRLKRFYKSLGFKTSSGTCKEIGLRYNMVYWGGA